MLPKEDKGTKISFIRTISARARCLLLLSPMLAASCVTNKPLPGAAQVRVTRNQADVAKCRELGSVFLKTAGRFTDSNVAVDQLRGETAKLGGNSLLLLDDRVFTPSGVPESGMAYSCP